MSDIEPDFVCTACGKRGADVRPITPEAGGALGRARGLANEKGRPMGRPVEVEVMWPVVRDSLEGGIVPARSGERMGIRDSPPSVVKRTERTSRLD